MASKTSEKVSHFCSQLHEYSNFSSPRMLNGGNVSMIDLRSYDRTKMQSIKKEESANNIAQECPRNLNSSFQSVQGLNEKSSLVLKNLNQSLPLISVKAIASRRSGFRQIQEDKSRTEIVSHVFGNRKGEFERNCRFYGIIDSCDSFSHEQTPLSAKEVIYNNLNSPIQGKNLYTTGVIPTYKLQSNKKSDLNVLHTFQDNLRKQQQQDFHLKNSRNQKIKGNNNSSTCQNQQQHETVQLPVISQSHTNPSKLSGKSRMQNLDSLNEIWKNVKIDPDSESCPVYSIQQNLAEMKFQNTEQQTRVFAELSELILNPQKMHENLTQNSMLILQQCASLTQAGMTHFAFSRLLADFNAFPSSTLESSSSEQIIDEDTHTPIFQELDTHIHRQSPFQHTHSQSQHKAISISSTCSFQAEISPTLENCKKETLFHNISTYLNDENKQSAEIKLPQNHKKSFIEQCKSTFTLKPLSSQQLSQFRFAQYKKKNPSGADQPGNVSKFGKYHNYNKLFMYNILNMFQPNNLISLGVPDHISKELQLLISRIKNSAKNNYKVEGKYAFDYFSHAHYNILFLSITKENLPSLSAQSEFVDLYQACFNIDIRIPLSSITLAYINVIKLFCYQIFLECICESSIHTDNSMIQENLKNLYTLKVIKGIKKLSQGMIIKRF